MGEKENQFNKQSKKLILFNILDILKKYSDENHRLSQKQIEDILLSEYEMKIDRKTIKASLMKLEEFGYELEYTEKLRDVKNKKTGETEESYILSDFYLHRDIEDSELRLLIDSLLFSKNIPYSQCNRLIKKLEKMSNVYFKSRVKHVATMTQDKTDNKQIFYTIDIIDEAISQNKKVRFRYLEYHTDLTMAPRRDYKGDEREYIVSPYQMAAKEGKYYVICNHDKYNDIANYRIDRIDNIEILDEPVKPFESLVGSNGRKLDLAKYMNEHIFMYGGGVTYAKLRIKNAMISDIVDMFGKEVTFSNQDDNYVDVRVKANEISVLQFAKNFSPDVMIIEPKELKDKAIDNLKESLKAYEDIK